MNPEQLLQEKLAYANSLEEKIRLQEGLSFLHGWKWYGWAKEFFDSINKVNLLCAGNQLSKSSTQIRKCIDWATNTAKWPALWNLKPNQFWYFYPTNDVAEIEFETKWKQFLPAGEFKKHPMYGWEDEWKNKKLISIKFNTGVVVYFKSYAQAAKNLQTATVYAMFADEEMPMDLYEELMFRLSASSGYFHMVFTATLGQEFWRLAMEPGTHEKESLPGAKKWTVSAYDCQKYEDGTASHWTDEKIQEVINKCSTHNEVLKRVFGRFILASGGRKYEQFDIKRHMGAKKKIPEDWHIYGGADIGSGGTDGHPSAITFVAVSPDFRRGRVFRGWRGDGIITTAADVVKKFIELRGTLNLNAQYYDHQCRDFFTIAQQMNEPFIPAEKSHEIGEHIINVLFKNDLLTIDEDPELHKLAQELASLKKNTPKNKAHDDFSDSFRYAVSLIPWDWSVITGDKPRDWVEPEKPQTDMERQINERRKAFETKPEDDFPSIEKEFEEWNSYYG